MECQRGYPAFCRIHESRLCSEPEITNTKNPNNVNATRSRDSVNRWRTGPVGHDGCYSLMGVDVCLIRST